jgi:hypothetical protein
MIPAEDQFILNLSASCTTDQAVLRLIGWGRDTVYLTDIKQTGDSDFLKKHMLIYRPDFGLNEFLSGLYKQALLLYAADVPEDATEEDVQRALDLHAHRIDETQAFIEKARSYKMDIVDELAKGDGSALRLDKEATAQSGIAHITIKSLDAWSKPTDSIKTDAATPVPETDIHALLETVKDVDGTTKSDASLYVTLALAVQAFAEKAGPKFLRDGDDVNVKQVAEHLTSLGAKQRAQGGNLPSQSEASIRSRITTALNRHRMVKGH